MLTKLTKVAINVDSSNRNVSDTDLLDANERYHPAPPTGTDKTTQWSYKEALVAIKAAKAITVHQKEISESATTHVYSTNPLTLSANQRFGGQNVSYINYSNPDEQRTKDFFDLIGRTSTQNRLFDAKNLIEDNKLWIASAPSITDASSPVSGYAECTRDMQFFLEAIAYNLENGGNNRVYDYAFISRKSLEEQAAREGRTIESIIVDYKIAFNGDGTLESVRDRLEAVINGSAVIDGQTLLESTGITVSENNCIDVVSSAHTFLDLILLILEEGSGAPVSRSIFFGNNLIGNGRLNDAAKLITDPSIRTWISNPPSIDDTTKFPADKCPRDLGYFIDAIAYNLIRGGNSQVYDFAMQSRTSLLNQAQKSTEARTYEELIYDYMTAFNGTVSKTGFRERLKEVIQGTAVIEGVPLDISAYDVTPASDLCSDVVSAVYCYLDLILLILKEGGQAVTRSVIIGEPFLVPDNRENPGNIYEEPPYSYDRVQVSKCLRDVEYYVRYITYGLVANDFGIIDELFLNGLVEVNKAFNLEGSWYRTALDWIKQDLTARRDYYFGDGDDTYTMPSDPSTSLIISPQDKLDKALEFFDYVQSRV